VREREGVIDGDMYLLTYKRDMMVKSQPVAGHVLACWSPAAFYLIHSAYSAAALTAALPASRILVKTMVIR